MRCFQEIIFLSQINKEPNNRINPIILPCIRLHEADSFFLFFWWLTPISGVGLLMAA